MRHRLVYLIVRALVAIVRVTPGFIVRGAGTAIGLAAAYTVARPHRRDEFLDRLRLIARRLVVGLEVEEGSHEARKQTAMRAEANPARFVLFAA